MDMASSNCETNFNNTDLCTKKKEFENWLMNKTSRQSSMVSRSHGEKIIQFLREQREKGSANLEVKAKFSPAFRFQVKKRKFQLVNVVGLGDILCLPKDKSKSSHAMLGEHRQVIFKEDMFGVIDSSHKNGEKHRGYKGTFKKINASYCNIPREIVHKYVSMCKFCQKSHACFIPTSITQAKKSKKISAKKKLIEPGFLTRCQIDILDLRNFPDVENNYSYIGHFFDHHTKYNVLFPLKQNDANTVATTLCQHVFGHFGLPTILHSNVGRKFVDELILWVLQFWSTDAQIFNGNPKYKDLNLFILQRQKTIVILIETMKAKQPEFSNWSSLLPGIQYSLNTNQFECNTTPSYDIVYHRRPKVYSFNNVPVKDILREEDMFYEDAEVNQTISGENNINEVITVSVSDFIQSGNSTLIIPQVNNSLQQAKHAASSTATISNDLLCEPLSLNEQYTIIATAGLSTSGLGTTDQIPVVNVNNNSLDEQNSAVLNVHQGFEECNVGHVRTFDSGHTSNNLQLTNIVEINVDNVDSHVVSVDDQHATSNMSLTNTGAIHLRLTDEDVPLEYESYHQVSMETNESQEN